MRIDNLDFRDSLESSTLPSLVRFAGERLLLCDASAMGLLRRELIGALGLTAARGVLTRYGFAHGARTAELGRAPLPWDDWPLVWHDSFEAEQHLLHHGQADEPVCWTLAGFVSGLLTQLNGQPFYCVEDRCRGRGDAICRFVGRPRSEWDPAVLEKIVPFFDREGAGADATLLRLTAELRKTERKLRIRRRDLEGEGDGEGIDPGSGLVARSTAMRRVLGMAARVAAVDSIVLLSGESGVGKERLARHIHAESPRGGGAFIAVHLSAVPELLLESELFGHVRGALPFPGAGADRPGLFEAAQGGTLLLDEIGDLPLAAQAKLLRVLQEREVRRVGEDRGRPVDVRVLAATQRDLAADVAAGRFRQDLYYRLRVIELRIPPLRERKEDLLSLARLFAAEKARVLGRKIAGFSPEALGRIVRYSWPGNVRELENSVERAVVLTEGERIEETDLPEELLRALPVPKSSVTTRPLDDVERDHILAAVQNAGGNKTRAAHELGIGIATLHRKLRQYEQTPKN